MKKALLLLAVLLSTASPAAMIEIENVAEFDELVQTAQAPVVIQFSAYWCGPCKALSATMNSVASSYSDEQVIIAKVDAYVNSSLGKYLKGGYPTVRTFYQGELKTPYFVGSKSSSFVMDFINNFVESPSLRMDLESEVGPHCPVN